jgi:glutamine amidotransferase/cyclase
MLEREKAGEKALSGLTGIETIAAGYGSQAVVVSIDPRRVYLDTTEEGWYDKFPDAHLPCLIIGDHAISATKVEEKGKAWWYQCTIKGGREVRDIDVVQLAKGVEKLGAGEILLNSVDRDGSGKGFDLDLVKLVKDSVSIPVVASSGAGKVEDFSDVFKVTDVEAALAAGIFHREEVPIEAVKDHLAAERVPIRLTKLST